MSSADTIFNSPKHIINTDGQDLSIRNGRGEISTVPGIRIPRNSNLVADRVDRERGLAWPVGLRPDSPGKAPRASIFAKPGRAIWGIPVQRPQPRRDPEDWEL